MNPALSSIAQRRLARIQQLSAIEYPADLPVVARREELAQAIEKHQVVIVCGETGSGKTTQLPKICLSLGRGVLGVIGHTQPRRVAARSVGARIAHELKSELGGLVGYKVRFNDKVSPDTCIKLMTDGILLAEIHHDPNLRQYDTIIIDEAHERSLNIDFLLGYLRQLLPRRPDLKLIITSATLDAERFSRHFANAPVLQVSGRTYPVEVRYRPPQQNEEGDMQDVPQAICSALDELSIGGLKGDVLVFLPGEREIRDTAEALRKHQHKGIEILPLFSRLSVAEQDRVFKPASGMRRVVLATNVAETSLTVPNIGYVIDSGLARINRYSVRQKVEQLRIENIARAAANQRAGRCGRVMSGVCLRLYDEADFLQRPEFTDAEIFRVSLATVILRMSALGLGEVEEFPFIEPPGSRAIADGYQLLQELNAIDDKRQLTPLGHELAKLPLDPKIARLLLAGRQYHCLDEILIIASALALQDPRDRPSERREAADAAHQRFNDERSDFLAYIKLWAWFQEAHEAQEDQQAVGERVPREVPVAAAPARMARAAPATACAGVGNGHALQRAARHLRTDPQGAADRPARQHRHTRGERAALPRPARDQVLHRVEFGAGKEGGEVGGGGRDRGDDQTVRALRGAHRAGVAGRGRRAPDQTQLFRRALGEEGGAGGGVGAQHPVRPAHQPEEARALRADESGGVARGVHPRGAGERRVQHPGAVLRAQPETDRRHRGAGTQGAPPRRAGGRRAHLRVLRPRIPAGMHNGAAFEHWRKEAEREQPKLLYLKKDDLMRHEAAGITTEQFPPQLQMNNVSYALAYNFAPGKSDDGVTLTAPQALLNQVSAARCEYLVPGILAEKIAQLVKSLPQKLRRHCVPVPEFAAAFCAAVKPSDTPLLQALARYIREQKQIDVPLDAFRLEQLPAHLLMNFRVVDEHGRQLGMSRNFAQLRGEWAPKQVVVAAAATAKTAAPQPKSSGERYTDWRFGDFRPTRDEMRAGQTITVFNALVDEGDAVSLQSFDTQDAARAAHRLGLRRLFQLALKEQVKYLEKNLPGLQAMAMQWLPFGSQQDLQRQILAVTFDRCCLNEPWPESEKDFAARCKEAKARLNLVAQEIARLVGAVLAEHQALQKALPGFKAHGQVTQDIRSQCEWLLGKEWVARTPYERLQHLPRYLKAINVRLEKLRGNPARDVQNMAQMNPLLQQWQRKMSARQGEADARLDDFGWMLQELRVSLFAQELKTPVIVSVKRLEKMLAGLSG